MVQCWPCCSGPRWDFLYGVLPCVFHSKNGSISLLWENNHWWLNDLDTIRPHKSLIRKIRWAEYPTFRFICYSCNFNTQGFFLQWILSSCTGMRPANTRISFCHLNFTQISSYSQKIQGLTQNHFTSEAVTTGISWKEVAVVCKMNKYLSITPVQITFAFGTLEKLNS